MSSLADTALPGPSASPAASPDVVVIGAGAAGIAAARVLIADGMSVVVLEAADRVGARAHTESATFGVPYDHGCAWLQGPQDLEYLALARQLGFTLVDHDSAREAQYMGGKPAKAAERRRYDRTWEAIEDALEDAEGDISAAAAIPRGLPYSTSVQSWIGPLDHGVVFADLSNADYNGYAEQEASYLVREGYGTLVARIVGSRARRHFVRGHLSGWHDNPHTLGAYAAARPGRFAARAALARPLGERVFFAGEAVAAEVLDNLGVPCASGSREARTRQRQRIRRAAQ